MRKLGRINAPQILVVVCFLMTVVASSLAQNPPKTPSLPAGMVGSDANDPRAKLAAGFYDAGEAAMGLKHITLIKKPDAFQLGSDNPDDERVKKTIELMGSDAEQIPKDARLIVAGMAFSNSDLAFQGNHVFVGNFYGVNVYDVSGPDNAKLVTSILCPGGQGDVSVFRNLMFMSVEMPNGRLDCGEEGFALSADAAKPWMPIAEKQRFRGVRIFDISDIRSPKQVAAVQTCRGSHTHTLVVDPKDKDNVYIYVSGASYVRQNEELAGCMDGAPDKNPDTALFRIDVIKVPVAAPQNSKVVSSPRVFMDARTGVVNSLNNGGTHTPDGISKPSDTDHCHDITAYSELGLAAGACEGNGIVLDIREPANPKRVDAVSDTNYAYWHSAAFSNDGKKVVFTDEWGGGLGARCRATDPNKWGANAIFKLDENKLNFVSYYKMPAAQSNTENCVAHNGSLIPVPGRDLKVQAWYQGGISVMDFTNPTKPMEIAYFDRGPLDKTMLMMGGFWSAYWYNGRIYGSEIARGLDIFELTPTANLSQNEIDAAKLVKVAEFNVQNQERIKWPQSFVVARAYVDQLERAQTLPADRIAKIRQTIASAETAANDKGKLKKLGKDLDKSAKKVVDETDASRMRSLAELLRNLSR